MSEHGMDHAGVDMRLRALCLHHVTIFLNNLKEFAGKNDLQVVQRRALLDASLELTEEVDREAENHACKAFPDARSWFQTAIKQFATQETEIRYESEGEEGYRFY